MVDLLDFNTATVYFRDGTCEKCSFAKPITDDFEGLMFGLSDGLYYFYNNKFYRYHPDLIIYRPAMSLLRGDYAECDMSECLLVEHDIDHIEIKKKEYIEYVSEKVLDKF